MSELLTRLRAASCAVQLGGLAAIAAVVAAIACPIAMHQFGWTGVKAATTAAGLCLLGSSLALAISRRYREPDQVLIGFLLGMLVRMGLPLCGGILIQIRCGPLAKAGFLVYLVLFYLVTLAGETILSLPDHRVAGRVTEK